MRTEAIGGRERIDWVDYAKGFCIVMVVTWHSTLGVEAAAGAESWMHALVSFTTPFRMPDFFLVSGLFLARVIDRDWRGFLDRRVAHFAYFYVLWLTIQFGLKAPVFAGEMGALGALQFYLVSFIDPFGLMWFIYVLAIFFAVTKLLRKVPPLLVFTAAAGLEIAPVETGWVVIDEFAARYVYFFAGYWLAEYVFAFADRVRAHRSIALGGFALWVALNAAFVAYGWATLPFLSLVLGFLGAVSVVTLAVFLADARAFEPLRYIGEHSLVIYLAFFLSMAVTRVVLLKSGIVPDLGSVALIVTAAAVTGPLVLHWLVRGTRLSFLFERPDRFRLEPPRRAALQPAE